MVRPFKSTKDKSVKEKLKDLREILSGQKTLAEIVKETQPAKFYVVVERDGVFTIDGVQMNEKEYTEWKNQEIPPSRMLIDKIIVLQRCSAKNAPIIDSD